MTRAVQRLLPGVRRGAPARARVRPGPRHPSPSARRTVLRRGRPPGVEPDLSDPGRLSRDHGRAGDERRPRLPAGQLPGDDPLHRPHSLRTHLPAGEAPPGRRGGPGPARPLPLRRRPGRRGAAAEVRKAARSRTRAAACMPSRRDGRRAWCSPAWRSPGSTQRRSRRRSATRACGWTSSRTWRSRCSSASRPRSPALPPAHLLPRARQWRARRAPDGNEPAPRATCTSSPRTTCSPSTPAAAARIAITISFATSCGSGSSRTRARAHSERCSARPPSRWRPAATVPEPSSSCSAPTKLDLALGVIARGGEAELERRPSEQLRLWVGKLSPAADAGQPWALVVTAVLDAREGRSRQR